MLAPKTNIQFGNKKLPNTTGIFNVCSAHDCPSKARGLCQVINAGHRCYALRDEQMYSAVLPYRRRQEVVWDALTAKGFASAFLAIVGRRRIKTTALRLNESGDFRTQADVDKAEEIAALIRPYGIKTYCYTARRDLDFSHVKTMIVNGSGFKVHGEFRFIGKTAPVPTGYRECPGSCKSCTRCTLGKQTVVRPH